MESSKFSRRNGIPPKAGKVQSSKRKILFAICCLLFANLMGCAMLKETAKGFAGLSTKELEKGRKDAIKKTFNYDFDTCYDKVKDTLNRIGSYIYAKDAKKQMIAIYVSESDTTPVGIFFKKIDTTNTQIEVSSPSTYAKEFIATRVFPALEKSLTAKAQIKQVSVNISNAQGRPGQKDIVVPVSVSDVTGLGFISCQLTLKYAPDLLTLTGVNNVNSLTQGWGEPVYNIKQGEVVVVLYGTNELNGSGVLVNFVFAVNKKANTGITNLDLAQATFNDGKFPSVLIDGVFTVISQ